MAPFGYVIRSAMLFGVCVCVWSPSHKACRARLLRTSEQIQLCVRLVRRGLGWRPLDSHLAGNLAVGSFCFIVFGFAARRRHSHWAARERLECGHEK